MAHTIYRFQKFFLVHFRPSILSTNFFCSHIDDDKMLQKILDSYNDIKMTPFRMRSCDFGSSFTQAVLRCVPYRLDNRGNLISNPCWKSFERPDLDGVTPTSYGIELKYLYENGVAGIFDSFGHGNDENNKRKYLGLATEALIKFIKSKDFHGECLSVINSLNNYDTSIKRTPEKILTQVLANHLFSRLAPERNGKNYIVSNDVISSRSDFQQIKCPCNHCNDLILAGNSGLGSRYLWYGQPDIIVFPGNEISCVVSIEQTMTEEEEENNIKNSHKHIVEEKCEQFLLRREDNVRQIISQAITFAFYQKKFQLRNCYVDQNFETVTLIPTIAVCGNAFDIYMYDIEHDVLLRNHGDPIIFWSYGQFNLSAVLQIWMQINHILLKPKLTETYVEKLKGTCGLKQYFSEKQLQAIFTTISMRPSFNYELDSDSCNLILIPPK